MNNYKLTSVKILSGLYKKFKISGLNDGLNLQKLVNRSINLCETNEEFRKIINNHDELTVSGSY
tara:strand:+ start:69 stop:260 length:192 start_codon:yes stop_codon:yes gene_type:complete